MSALDPAVNALLKVLQPNIQDILGDDLIGLYLDGSLALGDFDAASDIDFVAVVTDEIAGTSPRFAALYAMHERIATLDTPWAIQLEGSYISARALQRHDPALVQHPNLERGSGERLKMAAHDEMWSVHRQVLREHGIVLAGPHPRTLIDPVDPEQLRDAMRMGLPWLAGFLHEPTKIALRGYQSYIVLTVCRMRYTLAHGTVVSKPAAARWVQAALGEPWSGLIARAWMGRSAPDQPADASEVAATLAFIRMTLASFMPPHPNA